MIIGRLFGWALLFLSIVMASGDVVMALGSLKHHGLAAADLWTLLTGQNPYNFTIESGEDRFKLSTAILSMPAWTILGPLSMVLLYLFRSKRLPLGLF